MVDSMANINYLNHDNKPPIQRGFTDEFKKKKIGELKRNISSIPNICKIYSVSW
jgi:hypothetical protein